MSRTLYQSKKSLKFAMRSTYSQTNYLRGDNVREKEAFRDNLERIIEAFPGQEIIKTKQLARWLKMDPRTVEKRFPVKPGLGISVATLARWMS